MLEKIVSLLKPSVDISTKVTGLSLFIGKSLESFNDRIFRLEQRQLQKGDKGDKGDSIKGDKGDKGDPGKDGIGRDGKDGKDANPAKDGKDGISVVDSWIAADGHLVMKLSNGNEIDAGNPFELDSGKSSNYQINTQLANLQITVSTVAPASPVLNQLWMDIN